MLAAMVDASRRFQVQTDPPPGSTLAIVPALCPTIDGQISGNVNVGQYGTFVELFIESANGKAKTLLTLSQFEELKRLVADLARSLEALPPAPPPRKP